MLIGIADTNLTNDITVKVFEPTVNRDASTYVINNYQSLLSFIPKLRYGIRAEKACDLLHDVFISLVEAENNGEGFDMEYGSGYDEEGNYNIHVMDISNFVKGRIKLYARNSKYQSDVVEVGNSYVKSVETYYVTELDKNGKEVLGKDGQVKKLKRTQEVKKKVMLPTMASSCNSDGEDLDKLNDFQKAYSLASSADSTDDLVELMSLTEQIDYCIDICSLHGINIVNILKNIDSMANLLGLDTKKRSSESIFSKLSSLVEYHTEFGQTLMEVIKFSATHKSTFNSIIATY